jgi:hypothetical protein
MLQALITKKKKTLVFFGLLGCDGMKSFVSPFNSKEGDGIWLQKH